ncbi:hypothetical protein [Xanthomarina gelatinilytica]|uniref:hypothetical protein n=1 Tax=Xanthomarina gelatinilytica TaxID=1137281 RepID=UPI003AA7DB1F
MKKIILILLVSCFYISMVSCTPEEVAESAKTAECCGNEGDLPPPPPPPPGG